MMSEAKTDLRSAVTVRRWADVDRPERLTGQLDAIFFEASGTKSFASEEARAAFRERWFARYLVQHLEGLRVTSKSNPGEKSLVETAEFALSLLPVTSGSKQRKKKAPRTGSTGTRKKSKQLQKD